MSKTNTGLNCSGGFGRLEGEIHSLSTQTLKLFEPEAFAEIYHIKTKLNCRNEISAEIYPEKAA